MTRHQGLRELAAACGIAPHYIDARGTHIEVDDEVLGKLLDSMGIKDQNRSTPADMPRCVVVRSDGGQAAVPFWRRAAGDIVDWRLTHENGVTSFGRTAIQSAADRTPTLVLKDVPFGYHRLSVDGFQGVTSLIATPGRCWLPDHFATGEKSWGVSLQLYLLRSRRNWGIGDFSDLARLSEYLGDLGCDVVGLNPLHQMFIDDPEHASPYSPSDRQFLNVLNIDVPSIPEFSQSDEARGLVASSDFQDALQACQTATKVDYAAACALKLTALRVVYTTFLAKGDPERTENFRAFVADAGEPLQRASLFQALRSHFGKELGHSAAWDIWPVEFRSATSPATGRFASSYDHEIWFLNWLQWIADRQLKEASDRAIAAGMRIGLYRDLAVGCDRNGGELWSDPHAFLKGVLVGAPPDILNPGGQNWGLPPFNPASLTDRAYAPFIRLIRANMRHAGGVRIDHVMGLQRLYCIPEGSRDGAYISYPVDDLIGILALESHRHRCLVVGEDLGTVPEGFRERMAAANILSYRVAFFEQADGDSYISAEQYPRLAVAVAGSHDLPTLRSWLSGSDIELRHSLGLYPSERETEWQWRERTRQWSQIFKLLELEEPVDGRSFGDAMHAFLAQTNSLLAVVQFDDLVGEIEPVNVPGTSTEYANWRRKHEIELEQFLHSSFVHEALAPLQSGRRSRPMRVRNFDRKVNR